MLLATQRDVLDAGGGAGASVEPTVGEKGADLPFQPTKPSAQPPSAPDVDSSLPQLPMADAGAAVPAPSASAADPPRRGRPAAQRRRQAEIRAAYGV
ncbi:hypothetical protein HK405_015365 [Cladochytrium tenue]|nr:hypothetical protein HK405_015365 [Cladochytrium tenue]